jgi:prolyl-tRNA synthetase
LCSQGVPLRLEVGPKDLEKDTILSVRRDNAVKASLPAADITTAIPKLLEQIQQDMFNKAKAEVDGRRIVVEKWEDLVPVLDKKNTAILPWCEEPACEEDIKDRSKKESLAASKMEDDDRAPSSGAKTLCIPFDQSRWPSIEGKCCPACGKEAKRWTMFGRSASIFGLPASIVPTLMTSPLLRLLIMRSSQGQKGGRAALLYEFPRDLGRRQQPQRGEI